MNDRYYQLIGDRGLINAFIDKRKKELGVSAAKQLSYEQLVQIQNEFLEQCRLEATSNEEQTNEPQH